MKKTERNLLSTEELGFFCGQLALMLQGGIPIYEGIEALNENYKTTRYASAFSTVYEETQVGHSLSGAMEMSGLFPAYAVRMVQVGEETGKLESVLTSLSRHYERESSIKTAVRNAVRYPIVLMCIMTAVVFVLNLKVLPLLKRVLASLGSESSTVSSVTMKTGIVLGIVVMVLTLLLLISTVIISALIRSGKGDGLMDKLGRVVPGIVSLRAKISAERFLSVMSISLSAGCQTEETMERCAAMVNDSASSRKVNLILEKVTGGMPMGDAVMQSDFIEPLKARMIRVGFLTGHSEEVTAHVAELYAKEADEDLERTLGLLEPILVSVLAAVIGCILLSVIVPLAGVMSFFI